MTKEREGEGGRCGERGERGERSRQTRPDEEERRVRESPRASGSGFADRKLQCHRAHPHREARPSALRCEEV
eukprot:3360512-Rhodomonas_salina.1